MIRTSESRLFKFAFCFTKKQTLPFVFHSNQSIHPSSHTENQSISLSNQINQTVSDHLTPFLNLGIPELLLDFSYRRIIILGGRQGRSKILCENIPYDTDGQSLKRLDIYLPPDWLSSSPDDHHQPQSALAPVIVFLHPGGWSLTHKGLYIQLALRLRRLGFCVVIPNFVSKPPSVLTRSWSRSSDPSSP